jgi:hypothetical protein
LKLGSFPLLSDKLSARTLLGDLEVPHISASVDDACYLNATFHGAEEEDVVADAERAASWNTKALA